MADEQNHMDPNVWGPPLWDMLFTICFKVPKTSETIADLQQLFVLLEKVIPCSNCRRSYAMYRKEVKPTSSIRTSDANSAAVWLWTIHDMVNQKLGKICISFDKLQKRHASTTFITHDVVVLDILTIFALASKPVMFDKSIEFVCVISRLLRATSCFFKLPDLIDALSLSSDNLHDSMFELHNSLYCLYNITPCTKQAFEAQYKNARA